MRLTLIYIPVVLAAGLLVCYYFYRFKGGLEVILRNEPDLETDAPVYDLEFPWGSLWKIGQEKIVSSTEFSRFADFVLRSANASINATAARDGTIFYVKTNYISKVHSFAVTNNTTKYVVITHESDYCIPCEKPSSRNLELEILKDPNLIGWYALNVMEAQNKLICIPYGPDGNGPALQEKYIRQFRKNFTDRKINVYVNFEPKHAKSREPVWKKFCGSDKTNLTGVVCHRNIPVSNYMEDLGNARFVISPLGNGMDCYRHYESMLMGAIPIVQRYGLPGLFHRMPMLLVNSYDEVTDDFLIGGYLSLQNNRHLFSMEKVYMSYWKRDIEQRMGERGVERRL